MKVKFSVGLLFIILSLLVISHYRLSSTATSDIHIELDESVYTSIYITMDEDDLNELFTRCHKINKRLPATVHIGDSEEPKSGRIRIRGNSTRREPKKGLSIRFDGDELDGVVSGDRLNLRSMWRDPSFMREYLSMWLFREFGLYAPDTRYFQVFINGVYEGLYLHAERIDETFVSQRDISDSYTLFRDQASIDNDIAWINSRTLFSKKNNLTSLYKKGCLDDIKDVVHVRSVVNWQDIYDFVMWSHSIDSLGLEVEKYIDVDYLIAFLGVHILVGDIDALLKNDYWLFRDYTDTNSRWIFFPWDKNITFGSSWWLNFPDGIDHPGANLFFFYEHDLSQFMVDNSLFLSVIDSPYLMEKLKQWLLDAVNSELWNTRLDEKFSMLLDRNSQFGKIYGLHYSEFEKNSENRFPLVDEYYPHVEQVITYRDLKSNYIRRFVNGFTDDICRHSVTLILPEKHLAGTPLWFVDDYGFTVARLIPEHDIDSGSIIIVSAKKGSSLRALNHHWSFYSSMDISGMFSLYYRNNRFEGTQPRSNSNWYSAGLYSVGRQEDMKIASRSVGLIGSFKVRPLINRIDLDFNYRTVDEEVVVFTKMSYSAFYKFLLGILESIKLFFMGLYLTIIYLI